MFHLLLKNQTNQMEYFRGCNRTALSINVERKIIHAIFQVIILNVFPEGNYH
jgi:hypothetical protein